MNPHGVSEIFFEETYGVPADQTASAVLSRSLPFSYTFGRFQVLPVGRKLLVDGRAAPVGGRALDLLLTLIEHRERMLTKDELLDRVWPDAAVEPNNLAVQIGALRKLLGPDAIATIPGRGYRFGLPLDKPAPAPAPAPRAPAPPVHTAKLATTVPPTPIARIGPAEQSVAREALIDRQRLVTVRGQALANAAGARDRGEAAAALRSALAPLAMFLALDNAEHLLHAVSALAAALSDVAPLLNVVTGQARRLPQRRSARAPRPRASSGCEPPMRAAVAGGEPMRRRAGVAASCE